MINESKTSVATVYADKGWDGSQAAVCAFSRRRDGLSFACALAIAKIIGARHPMAALADAMMEEAVDFVLEKLNYVDSRNQW